MVLFYFIIIFFVITNICREKSEFEWVSAISQRYLRNLRKFIDKFVRKSCRKGQPDGMFSRLFEKLQDDRPQSFVTEKNLSWILNQVHISIKCFWMIQRVWYFVFWNEVFHIIIVVQTKFIGKFNFHFKFSKFLVKNVIYVKVRYN